MENQQLSQVKSKDLVIGGHKLAKALGNDYVTELATRLDVALVRGNELQQKLDERGVVLEERADLIHAYSKTQCEFAEQLNCDSDNESILKAIHKLQQKLDAVLAENVALRKAHPQPFCSEMMKAIDAYIAKEDEVPEQGMMDAFFILRDSITLKSSQVEAILNAVRAEGAEAVAEYHKERFEFLKNTRRDASNDHKGSYLCALDVAKQLRAGSNEGATHD